MKFPRSLFLFLSFFLSLAKLSAASSPPEYVRQSKVAAMRWSYPQLYAFVEQIRAVSGLKADRDDESLEISDGVESFRLGTGFSATDLLQAPQLGTSLTYRLAIRAGEVDRFQLILNDNLRSMEVAGTSAGKVAAVSALAEKTLGGYAHFVGSASFYFCIIILILGCIGGAIFCVRVLSRVRIGAAVLLWLVATVIMPNLSHTYVNRLRRAGVQREAAMRLVNHSSDLIHQIYQREKVEDVAQWRDAVQFPA